MDLYHMDYAVLERSDHVAAFYDRYPRHRKLISINKPYVPGNDTDFALRHDWNSLLQEPVTDPDAVLFKQFSPTYFPPAQAMLDYVQAFANKHELSITFNHTVTKVTRASPTSPFEVHFDKNGRKGTVTCDVLLIGTGKIPVRPKPARGAEYVTYYDEMSTNPTDYEDKEVLIFGGGNSAMETVESLEDYSAHVHIATRSALIFAFQTHYVGDLRALNLGILDKYQLKSLDAHLGSQPASWSFAETILEKRKGKIFLLPPGNQTQFADPTRKGYHVVLGCFGFKPDTSIFDDTTMPRMSPGGKFPVVTSMYESSNVTNMYFIGSLMHSRDFRKSSGGFIHGFRYLVRTAVQYLRQRYSQTPYPRETLKMKYRAEDDTADVLAISRSMLTRVNSASSLYQMFGVLADVYILQLPPAGQSLQSGSYKVTHLKDVPLDALKSGLPHNFTKPGDKYFTVDLEYGEDFQGLGVMMHRRQKVSSYLKRRRVVVPEWEEDADEEYKRRFVPKDKWLSPYVAPKQVPPSVSDQVYLSMLKEEHSDLKNKAALTLEDTYADRNKFLHPVIRAWYRPSDNQPRLIATHHILEDFLTDWTLEEYELPLADFVSQQVRELVHIGTGRSAKDVNKDEL
jgi:thioredoxin reductase